MSSIQYRKNGDRMRGEWRSALRVLTALAALCGPAAAQNAVVTISGPPGNVLVHGSAQFAAAVTDAAGTPLDGSGLSWATSDSTVATIAASGMILGVAPGDVMVTASDANTGASASQVLHVVPASLTIQALSVPVHVGDSLKLSAAAMDAAGKPIPGIAFQFRSGEPAVAAISSDGTLTGAGEGFTTIEARIPSVTADPSLIATMAVHILPRPAYQINKLLSTGTTGTGVIAAVSSVSAVNSSEIGAIATLTNGGQAALLIENGKTTALAVTGQVLPNAGRMVVRIDSVSANARGDVALLIEYPSQWCNASVILFPHGQPEQELGAANCNNGLYPRSLASNGTVIYRFNDQILSAGAAGSPTLLFSIATQPATKDPVQSVNDFSPSRIGTFVLNTYRASGTHAYLYFDGKNLTQVFKDSDSIGGVVPINIDMPVGSDDGTFYTRVNGTNLEMLAQIAPGPTTRLIVNTNPVPGGTLGWIGSIVDAASGGVLMEADLNTNPYHSAVAVWNGKVLTEFAPLAGWGALMAGAMLSNGTAVVSGLLKGDTAITPLRAVSSSAASAVLIPAGTALAQTVPAAVDWHYGPRGGGPSGIVFRGAGDAIVSVASTVQVLASVGSTLPNGQVALWIGAAMGNQSGDLVFTAGYSTGNVVVRYRGGKLETLIDTAVTGAGPGLSTLSWANNYRGRYLAMNSRGDVAAASGYNPGGQYDIVLFDSFGAHLVAQLNTPAPGGGNFTNFQDLALDDSGRIVFSAQTSDGKSAVYFWDGNTLQRLIGIGDPGPSGLPVNEVSNVSGGGSGFVILLAFGNYQVRELRYFDGANMRVLQSTDTTFLDGTGISYFWENEATVSDDGDAHMMAATQDTGTGIYAHRSDGRDLIVARSRDALPAGERLIMPLSVGSSSGGRIYFTADVVIKGVEMLVLYEAIPQ